MKLNLPQIKIPNFDKDYALAGFLLALGLGIVIFATMLILSGCCSSPETTTRNTLDRVPIPEKVDTMKTQSQAIPVKVDTVRDTLYAIPRHTEYFNPDSSMKAELDAKLGTLITTQKPDTIDRWHLDSLQIYPTKIIKTSIWEFLGVGVAIAFGMLMILGGIIWWLKKTWAPVTAVAKVVGNITDASKTP